MPTLAEIEEAIRANKRVAFLLKHPQNSSAAEDAIAFLVHGVPCDKRGRKSSTTWADIKTVYDDIVTSGIPVDGAQSTQQLATIRILEKSIVRDILVGLVVAILAGIILAILKLH